MFLEKSPEVDDVDLSTWIQKLSEIVGRSLNGVNNPQFSNYYFVDQTETDQGAAGNGNSLKDIIDSIGTTKNATIAFQHNPIDGNTTVYTLSTSETVPSNIIIKFELGALISIDSGRTLTINTPANVDASHFKIFTGDGSVTFTNGGVVHAAWFGMDTSESDNHAFLKAAIDSLNYTAEGTNNTGGGTVLIDSGEFEFATTVRLEPTGSTIYINNLALEGTGPGSPQNWDNSTVLKYTGSGEYGVFDFVSCHGIHVKNMRLLLGVDKTNLVRVGADAAGEYSSWHISFDSVAFGGTTTYQATGALLHVYNTLHFNVRNCYFQYSPTAMILGENAAATSGVAGGYIGRAVFENNLFTGDIKLRRAMNINFISCQFSEKSENEPPTEPMTIATEGDKSVHGLSFIGCDFYGLSGDTGPTETAVDAEGVEGFVVSGSTVGEYLIGFDLDGSTAGGSVLTGNWFNMQQGTNPIGIKIRSTYGGEVSYGYNDMSAGMVSNSGVIVDDLRTIDAFTSTDATPSVGSGVGMHKIFKTAGTTTITDFDDGQYSQIITIIATDSITITDGTNIFLNGSANFSMAAQDTLTLFLLDDGNWYEVSRSDNT